MYYSAADDSPVFGPEALLAPTTFLLLVEQGVLHIPFCPGSLQIGIVLFTAVACVGDHVLRETAKMCFHLVQVRNEAVDVIGFLVNTEAQDELVFGPICTL